MSKILLNAAGEQKEGALSVLIQVSVDRDVWPTYQNLWNNWFAVVAVWFSFPTFVIAKVVLYS